MKSVILCLRSVIESYALLRAAVIFVLTRGVIRDKTQLVAWDAAGTPRV
jgi:hypothetical protein